MNMRHLMAGLAVSTLLLGSASAAFARGHHNGYMMDGWQGGCNGAPCYNLNGNYQGLTQEKRDALDKLMQERRAAVEPLAQQLEAKRLELNALSRNPNAKSEDISKLAQDVAQLQTQVHAANRDFQDKVQKELGVQMGPRGGMMGGYGPMHNGMMGGYGHGMGGNHHMRGWNN